MTIPTWQERVGPDYNDSAEPTAHEIAMEAEIAELRAALARAPLPAQVIFQPGRWNVLAEDDKPDPSRLLDVILSNGVCLMDREYSKIDWSEVRDWRYSAAPAQAPLPGQGASITNKQIIAALHANGIDTYPSKHGFDALQVSATSVPVLRKVIESLAAPAQASDAPATDEMLLELLREADDLLFIASDAMLKMGLRDKGSDCGLPHEVRRFALEFSNEGRDGPGVLQVRGTGRYRAWLTAARKVKRAAMSAPQD